MTVVTSDVVAMDDVLRQLVEEATGDCYGAVEAVALREALRVHAARVADAIRAVEFCAGRKIEDGEIEFAGRRYTFEREVKTVAQHRNIQGHAVEHAVARADGDASRAARIAVEVMAELYVTDSVRARKEGLALLDLDPREVVDEREADTRKLVAIDLTKRSRR